jgi:hypothetical protein
MNLDPGGHRSSKLKRAVRGLPVKRALVMPLVVGIALLGSDGAAAAAVNDGPCRFFINGAPSTDFFDQQHALQVASDQDLVISGRVAGRFKQYSAWLRFADFKYLAATGSPDGPSFSRVVNVKDYARYGVGIYKVLAAADVVSPEATCDNDAYISVSGNPMTTVAGLVAAGAGALGLGGVAAGAGAAAGEGKGTTDEWEKEDDRLRQERREIREVVPELGCIGCLLPMSLVGVIAVVGLVLGLSALWSALV